jgi:predicted ferric reductase
MPETARPFSAPAAPVPPPTSRASLLLREFIVVGVFAANGLVIFGLWLSHGHLAAASTATILTAAGQLAALAGTYLALAGLLLVARTPLLDSLLGDRAARLHRIFGFGAVSMITVHVVATIGGYALADGISPLEELGSVVLTYPYMVAAAAAFGLFLLLGLSSLRLVRKAVSYETWTGLHLYAYLAVALAFGHQLVDGSDFATHPLARLYWIGLYTIVAGAILAYRVAAPIRLYARHRFRVDGVSIETSDVVSIHVGGRSLERLHAQPGQYFRLRLLARNEWWRSHPFSLSAVPDVDYLRFTVKSLGDFSERIQSVRSGTHVMLEGPYGALTSARRTTDSVALIGGGIGVSPIRALFEELAGKVDVTLVYRASRTRDLVFVDELRDLARDTGARVRYLVGRRGSPSMPSDPLTAAALRSLVPDIAARDVFLCGPVGMMQAVERSLRELGVPSWRIHTERFA